MNNYILPKFTVCNRDTFVPIGGCYFLITDEVMDGLQANADDLDEVSYTVVINDEEEFEFLRGLFTGYSVTSPVWVAGIDEHSNSTWKSVDDQPLPWISLDTGSNSANCTNATGSHCLRMSKEWDKLRAFECGEGCVGLPDVLREYNPSETELPQVCKFKHGDVIHRKLINFS